MKLLIISALLLFISCAKDKPAKKVAEVVVSPKQQEPPKNYSKMTSNEKILTRDSFVGSVRNEWERKVQELFNPKSTAYYSQYLQIKNQSMKEASDLLKAKKLDKLTSNRIHIKSHEILKRSIGPELYEEYIKMLRKENAENRKKGINFLIKF